MSKTFIPAGYEPKLSLYETQAAISLIKRTFQDHLAQALNLKRVSAPLFVEPATGLNDDLNGVERPVSFDIPAAGMDAQVVHSLAKWKRMALYRYDFQSGQGPLHRHERHPPGRGAGQPALRLRGPVGLGEGDHPARPRTLNYSEAKRCGTIVGAWRSAHASLICHGQLPQLHTAAGSTEVTFVTAQELEELYPDSSRPRSGRMPLCKEHPVTFLMGIGGKLPNRASPTTAAPPTTTTGPSTAISCSGTPCWSCAFELSSMGIRVDAASPGSSADAGRLRGNRAGAALPQDAAGRTSCP